MTRIMSLDVGRKRIGIALSDESETIARPWSTLERLGTRVDISKILAMAADQGAAKLLVGIPYSLDGTEGPQAEFVRRFIDALRQATDLPVDTWDERYSTTQAEETLREQGVPPMERRAQIDQVAAAWILQWYLDDKEHRQKASPLPAFTAPPGESSDPEIADHDSSSGQAK